MPLRPTSEFDSEAAWMSYCVPIERDAGKPQDQAVAICESYWNSKSYPVTIEKSASAAFDARFIMSASSPDRVKDTIDPAAYKANIGKKIIALWQHDSDQPFGFWHNLRMEAGALIGDLKVAGTNLGLMVKQLIADDVPLGASIGFRGKGEENQHGGIHFRSLDILECSVVSVPCHPLAMQIAKQFHIELPVQAQPTESVASDASVAARQRAARAIIGAKRAIKGV